MAVCLRLRKSKANEPNEHVSPASIGIQFWLNSGEKARVKFKWSVSSGGTVIREKKRTEMLEVQNNSTGWTRGDIYDPLPLPLPEELKVRLRNETLTRFAQTFLKIAAVSGSIPEHFAFQFRALLKVVVDIIEWEPNLP